MKPIRDFLLMIQRLFLAEVQNLYAWDISPGETQQLTNLKSGAAHCKFLIKTVGIETGNPQEAWLKKDQLQYFEVLRSRKEKKEKADAYTKEHKTKRLA